MNENKMAQNPIYILNNISQLVETILVSDIKDHSKIQELNKLKYLIQSCDQLTSTTACHGIHFLVEEDFLNVIPTISMLMAILPYAKHVSGIVNTLSRILVKDMFSRIEIGSSYECPFDLYRLQHPFVTILQQYSQYWPHILLETESLVSNTDERIQQNAIELMRPALLIMLCNPICKDFNGKLKTWELIISLLPSPSSRSLLEKAFNWLQLDNYENIEINNLILLQFYSYLTKSNADEEMLSGFAPIYATQALRLAKNGKDPSHFITLLINLHEKLDQKSSQIILIIIAEFISISPSPFLSSVLRLCVLLLEKHNYNCFIKNIIICSLLQWQVFLNRMMASSFKDTLKIFELVSKNKNSQSMSVLNDSVNEYLSTIISSDESVKFAYEISCSSEYWTRNKNHMLSWLSSLREECSVLKRFDLVITALILHNDLNVSIAAIDWLLILSKDSQKICFQTLSVVLYRITKETSPVFLQALLKKLPDLSLDKRNVTLILHTLESLKTVPSLGPFVLNLYVKFWIKDDRSAPYLEKILNVTPHNYEMQIARAHATRLIAETRPEQMSSDLARIISETLNKCTNEQGELASSEALLGIAALCRAKIIDIISAWKTLAPRFDHEKRPRVIASLCEFFSVIPSLRINNSKFFDLMFTVTQLLFKYFLHKNPMVVKSALKALTSYNMDEILIESLPTNLLTTDDKNKAPQTMLSFVSCDCWVRVLDACHPDALQECTHLIGLWLNKQNESTHTFQKEPSHLNYLPNYHIFKSMANKLLLLSEKTKLNDEEIKRIDSILMVLNRNFNKPLPPVNWLPCLNDLLQLDKKFHRNILGLCSRQAVHSPSARQCATNYISNFQWTFDNSTLIETLFDYLKYLGRSLQPDTLELFIRVCLDNALDECKKGTLNSNEHLKILIQYLSQALLFPQLHQVNKLHFSNVIKEFSNKLEPNSQEFSYTLECLKLIPDKPMECINFWNNSIEKTILLSCETVKYLYLEEKTRKPLVWLNDVIEFVAPLPDYHSLALVEITKVLIHCIKNKVAITKWLLELLGQTESFLINKSPQHQIEFFFDIFLILILILSGHDSFAKSNLPNSISIGQFKNIRLELFPFAIADLLAKDDWKNLSIQIIEWLLHMKNNDSDLIDISYSNCFSKALIHLKNIDYFQNSQVWLRAIN